MGKSLTKLLADSEKLPSEDNEMKKSKDMDEMIS